MCFVWTNQYIFSYINKKNSFINICLFVPKNQIFSSHTIKEKERETACDLLMIKYLRIEIAIVGYLFNLFNNIQESVIDVRMC